MPPRNQICFRGGTYSPASATHWPNLTCYILGLQICALFFHVFYSHGFDQIDSQCTLGPLVAPFLVVFNIKNLDLDAFLAPFGFFWDKFGVVVSNLFFASIVDRFLIDFGIFDRVKKRF